MAQTINQMKMKREMKSLEKENKLLKKENELLSVLIGAGEEDKFYEVKTENKKLKEELEELKDEVDRLLDINEKRSVEYHMFKTAEFDRVMKENKELKEELEKFKSHKLYERMGEEIGELKKKNELLLKKIGAGEGAKFYEVKTENKKLKEELEELKKDNDELYTWEDVEEKADDLLTSVISDAIDDEECVIGSSGLEDYIKKLKARITELEECNDELQEEIKGLTDDIEEAEENRRFSKSILCEANKKSNKWDKLIKAIKKSHEEMNPETEEFGYLDLWEELEELGVDTRGNETE